MSLSERFREAHARLGGEDLANELSRVFADLKADQAEAGWPIDPAIREVLLALWKHGFWTTFSCEGHLYEEDPREPDWRASPPQIGIEALGPMGLADDLHPLDLYELEAEACTPEHTQMICEWQRQNLRRKASMVDLLSEFYSARDVGYEIQLRPSSQCRGGSFLLMSVGADAFRIRPREEQIRLLPLFLSELQAFGEFLGSRQANGPAAEV